MSVVEAARGLDNAADDLRRLLGAARLTTMRIQQPIPSASKLAPGLAADPQHSLEVRKCQARKNHRTTMIVF
jgi:hypothetical protein